MKKSDDALSFLLSLNKLLADKEANGETVLGPGVPPDLVKKSVLLTTDSLAAPKIVV
jgi:hypothetical protein